MTCATCGNPVPGGDPMCPYCGDYQRVVDETREGKVETIDLEHGRPSAFEALERLKGFLGRTDGGKTRVVCAVHGYGSTGSGGAIRAAVRRWCGSVDSAHLVQAFVPGEQFNSKHDSGRAMVRRHPQLKRDSNWGRSNPGVTMIELPRAR